MVSNLAGILIFLSVCGIVASSSGRALDCRKFVFHPSCRGVASKRHHQSTINDDTAALLKEESIKYILKYIYSALAFLGNELYSKTGALTTENETENSARTFEGRLNPLLKFLFESRADSERDYSPAGEFANL